MPTATINTEYGPDWDKAITLLRTPGTGWDRSGLDQYWVEVMVRRFAKDYPGVLSEWLTVSGWMRVLLRRVQPGDPPQPDWLENEVRKFLTRGENRIGSENPWRIMTRTAAKNGYKVAEYSITRVPPLDKELQPNLDSSRAASTTVRLHDTDIQSRIGNNILH